MKIKIRVPIWLTKWILPTMFVDLEQRAELTGKASISVEKQYGPVKVTRWAEVEKKD